MRMPSSSLDGAYRCWKSENHATNPKDLQYDMEKILSTKNVPKQISYKSSKIAPPILQNCIQNNLKRPQQSSKNLPTSYLEKSWIPNIWSKIWYVSIQYCKDSLGKCLFALGILTTRCSFRWGFRIRAQNPRNPFTYPSFCKNLMKNCTEFVEI